MESRMVPDTVQLIVEVAGLCSWAPALEVMRPAGIAPRRSAHRKDWYHCVGTIYAFVDDFAGLGLEAVLFIPYVQRGSLERYVFGIRGNGLNLHAAH
jgi:hypothetical protein